MDARTHENLDQPGPAHGGEDTRPDGGGAHRTRPDYLSLDNIDRALQIGDVCVFAVAATFVVLFWRVTSIDWVVLAASIATASIVFAWVARGVDVYSIRSNEFGARLVRRLLRAIGVTFLFVIVIAFALGEGASETRNWIFLWLAAAIGSLLVFRMSVAFAVRQAMRRGHLVRRVAVFGGDAQGAAVMEHLRSSDDIQHTLVGYYDDRVNRAPEELQGLQRRGGLPELVAAIEAGDVDEVVIALPLAAVDRLNAIASQLSRLSVTVFFAPDLAMWRYFERPIDILGGVPMLHVADPPIGGWAGVAKFIEDRILATILLVLLSPILLLAAAAIRLDSPGPVLFRQPRRGWNGGIFTILKFRTMRAAPAEEEVVQATRDDPRVTRVGRFLRRTSIDELPQLFNVMQGDMSLVGPRPHALGTRADGELFENAVADYMRRYRVKPGITGWAQVNGYRGETNTNRKLMTRVRYDMYYIEHWSFWFDIYILAATPLALILRSDHAY